METLKTWDVMLISCAVTSLQNGEKVLGDTMLYDIILTLLLQLLPADEDKLCKVDEDKLPVSARVKLLRFNVSLHRSELQYIPNRGRGEG